MADDLKISHDLSVYPMRETKVLPVLESDWKLLRKKIENMTPITKFFGNIYSVCFGVAGSAFLSMIPNVPDDNEPYALIFWIYLIVGFAALVIGLVTLRLDFLQKNYVVNSSKSILDEMDSIELKFNVN